jgi:hypothetical protein
MPDGMAESLLVNPANPDKVIFFDKWDLFAYSQNETIVHKKTAFQAVLNRIRY